MLGDWYFSCCIGNNPRQTCALLAILDTLDNPHIDAMQIALAYAELPRMQVAERVYAFPRVLQSLRRADRPEGWSYLVSPYVKGLTDQLSHSEQQEDFTGLLKCATQKTSAADVRTALAKCLRWIVPPDAGLGQAVKSTSVHERPSPTSTPYLDVTQFIPEALWLAVAAHTAAGDDVVLSDLRRHDADPRRGEGAFLNDSLDGGFGRLAQRLAAGLTSLLRDNPKETVARLWRAELCAVPFEPDLLQAVAGLLFAGNTVPELLKEVATLAQFAATIDQHGMPKQDAVLRRLNAPDSEDLNALTVVFWQYALYDMSARIDPTALASEASDHWQQLPGRLPRRIELSTPVSSEQAALAHRALVSSLAKLRDVEIIPSRILSASLPRMHWLLSPWIGQNEKPDKYNPHAQADFAPTLVRLIGFSYIAARILPSAAEGPVRNSLAALIVHASDVLDTRYRSWLINHDKLPNQNMQILRRLPRSFTGLALFGDRQVQMVGRGELRDVPPETFLALVGEAGQGHFHSVILPKAMLSWIQDGYLGAVKGTGQERWLSHIPEVYNQFVERWQDHGPVDRRNATLLLRFLCPNDPGLETALARCNWDSEGRKWNVHGPDILTTRRLPPSRWTKPDWPEPDWDAPDGPPKPGVPNRNTRRGTRLARAIERVASLSLADKFSETVPDDQRQVWCQHLRDCLSQINNPQDLNRFTRLRLVELIDDDSLKNSPDDQLQIALVLLEYGSGYDVEKLLRMVFVLDGDATAARQQVRSALLAAMRQHQALYAGSKEREARDPRAVRNEIQKRDVIDNWLLRVGFDAAKALRASEAARVPAWARECIKVFQHKKGARARTVEATIVRTDRQAQAEVHTSISDVLVHAAVLAPDSATVTYFVDDVELNDMKNLFSCHKGEYQALLDSDSGTCLRVLARLVDINDAKNGTRRALFHCGMPWHPSCQLQQGDEDLQVGDWLVLPIEKRHKFWEISSREAIRKALPRKRAGDVWGFHIHEQCTEAGVWRLVPDPLWAGRFNIREWDADLSRRFRKPQPVDLKRRPVKAEYRADGTWAPVCGDLLDLVLDACRFQDGAVAVLTFVDQDPGPPYGERTYQFSTEPGKNYRLRRHDFHGDAIAQLDAEIARAGDANGLLVTVTPELREGRVALSLFAGRVTDERLMDLYKHLKPLFDWRNLHWRRVFEDTDPLVAEAENGAWLFRVDQDRMPGFPHIHLFLESTYRIGSDVAHIEFRLAEPPDGCFDEEWSTEAQWRSRSVRAWSDSNSLALGKLNSAQRTDFLKAWLNRKDGDLITLNRITKKVDVRRSSVVGFTAEGMPVEVDAASITMRRIPGSNNPQQGKRDYTIGRLDRPRQAVIRRVPSPDDVVPIGLSTAFPPELAVRDEINGIIYSASQNTCSVLWDGPSGPVPQEALTIERLGTPERTFDRKYLVGKIIRGRRTGAGCEYSVVQRMPRCQALWEVIDEAHANRDELIYLGPVDFDGQHFDIAEGRMGELVLLRSKPQRSQHLAIGNTPGLSPDDPTDNEAPDHPPWTEDKRRYKRASLPFGGDLVLGQTYDTAPRQYVGVYDVHMKVTKVKDTEPRLFRLSRTFELEKKVRRVEQRQPRPPARQRWLELLDAYIKDPEDIQTLYDPKDRTVTLDDSGKLPPRVPSGDEWTDVVRLHENYQTFLADPKYTDAGRATVRLTKGPEGRWWASFRHVPPMNAKGFRDHLSGCNWKPGTPLPGSLYYCGPEEADPVTHEPYGQTHHRFEWGYGKTLLVPENRLKFMDSPFNTTRLLICYGDWVTKLDFTDVGVSPPDYEINITEIGMDYEGCRSLYEQRSALKMVHALRLRFVRNKVVVELVEQLNEKYAYANTTSDLHLRQGSVLHEDDEARLLDRVGGSKSDVKILGRLDTAEFEKSGGKRVVFRHVRLTTARELGEAALQRGEILFMQGGQITDTLNDVKLEILPPDDLSNGDVGDDFKGLAILRRHFSQREDLLRRIRDEEGFDKLRGPILVRIVNDPGSSGARDEIETVPDDVAEVADGTEQPSTARGGRAAAQQQPRSTKVALSIKAVPARNRKLLGAALRGQQVLLATANPVRVDTMQVSDGDAQAGRDQKIGWRLELSPGVFVELPSTDIEETNERIEQGDIVQVKERNGKYRLLPAAFGHARYIAGHWRPAVALPGNALIKASQNDHHGILSSAFWQSKRKLPFTVGDLPGLKPPIPGRYDQDRGWVSPVPDAFVRLMQGEHPKLVWLSADEKGSPRIEPMIDTRRVGRLDTTDDLQVRYRPLSEGDSGWTKVTWRGISFADQPAREILQRCNTEKWRYHDDKTTTWPAAGPKGDRKDLPKYQTVFDGPLFFDVDGNHHPRLRYQRNELLRFGLPVDALIQSLRHRGTAKYPVVACSENIGFWIELVPGRVVEVPGRRVFCRLASHDLREAILDWPAFAPGDLVTLRLAEADPRKPDKIILDDWRPGPRGVFGSAHCFLPVQSFDKKSGALRVGLGEFALTLPETKGLPPGSCIILYPDNTIEPVDAPRPEYNDVVLLTVDKQGNLAIAGLPQLRPQLVPATRSNGWLDDEFDNTRSLAAFIRCIGGAIPVTVNRVFQGVLFFSQRTGDPIGRLPNEKRSIARIIGYAPESKCAILRFGASLCKMGMGHIVQGLPPACYAEAADRLKEASIGLWVQGSATNQIQVGFDDKRLTEFSVEALVDVSAGHQDRRVSGIICRSTDSGTLHWLREEFVAWTALSLPELSSVIKHAAASDESGRRRMRVCRTQAGALSIVDVQTIVKEFEQLTVGTRITVRDLGLPRTHNGRRTCLVESFASKVVFECVRYGDAPFCSEEFSVEITHQSRQSGRYLLQAALPEERRHHLRLPAWMLDCLKRDEMCRPQFVSYLDAVEQGPIQTAHADTMRQVNDAELNEKLCRAYGARLRCPGPSTDGFAIAEEWIERYLKSADELAVDVVPALCAAVVFARCAPTDLGDSRVRRKLASFLCSLGRRALGSIHAECISRLWLCSQDPPRRKESAGYWKRLNGEITRCIAGGDLTTTHLGDVQRFCEIVHIAGEAGCADKPLVAVADALQAALGRVASLTALYPAGPEARVCKELILVSSWLKPSVQTPVPEVLKLCMSRIEPLLNYVIQQSLDVTLLQAVPEIDFGV